VFLLDAGFLLGKNRWQAHVSGRFDFNCDFFPVKGQSVLLPFTHLQSSFSSGESLMAIFTIHSPNLPGIPGERLELRAQAGFHKVLSIDAIQAYVFPQNEQNRRQLTSGSCIGIKWLPV
jgi:hypothetical protein